MNKEELKDYLSENLSLEIRNDLFGNRHLIILLEDESITSVNLEQLFIEEEGGTFG